MYHSLYKDCDICSPLEVRKPSFWEHVSVSVSWLVLGYTVYWLFSLG